MELSRKIEAILFWKGESVSVKKLSEILKVSKEEVVSALSELKTSLSGRGLVLIEKEDEFLMGTAPDLGPLLEDLQKEELSRELSKASLETLSIVLYKNGASRSLIDYIRGVNSSFTLRALSVRGLVEKVVDEADNRRYVYKPSFELLSFMGISSVNELPDFEEVNKSINSSAVQMEKDLSDNDTKEGSESL